MIRNLLSAFAVASVLCAGAVVLAAPAQADTRNCVTKVEYQRVHEYKRGVRRGTEIERVHRIFGSRGRFLDGGAGGFVRDYRYCRGAAKHAGHGRFSIEYYTIFRAGRVIARVSSKGR